MKYTWVQDRGLDVNCITRVAPWNKLQIEAKVLKYKLFQDRVVSINVISKPGLEIESISRPRSWHTTNFYFNTPVVLKWSLFQDPGLKMTFISRPGLEITFISRPSSWNTRYVKTPVLKWILFQDVSLEIQKTIKTPVLKWSVLQNSGLEIN